MNRYRVLLPLVVHTADGAYAQGEVFEQEFSAEDERTNLESGLLELLPNRYKVIGESVVHDTEPGETFERALPLDVEALLVEGGHIKRVGGPRPDPEPDPPAAPAVKSTPRKTKEK